MVDLTLNTPALPVYVVDSSGNQRGPSTFVLANNIASLAANATTPQVVIRQSGTYALTAVLSGTSPSVVLCSIGPDGVTPINVVTLTTTGSQPVDVYAGGGGAVLYLKNTGSNPVTNLSVSLVI